MVVPRVHCAFARKIMSSEDDWDVEEPVLGVPPTSSKWDDEDNESDAKVLNILIEGNMGC